MPNVYVEARPKGRLDGTHIDDSTRLSIGRKDKVMPLLLRGCGT
jgi:hypothetical protein